MTSKFLPVVMTLMLLGSVVLSSPGTAVAATALTATMNGANEVGGGDPNGTGTADITFKGKKKKKICFDITVTEIQLPATFAHIHEGPAGVNGDPLVFLDPPGEDGLASGCTRAKRSLVKAIKQDPDDFYVNIHTGDFPNGAIRGQLAVQN